MQCLQPDTFKTYYLYYIIRLYVMCDIICDRSLIMLHI